MIWFRHRTLILNSLVTINQINAYTQPEEIVDSWLVENVTPLIILYSFRKRFRATFTNLLCIIEVTVKNIQLICIINFEISFNAEETSLHDESSVECLMPIHIKWVYLLIVWQLVLCVFNVYFSACVFLKQSVWKKRNKKIYDILALRCFFSFLSGSWTSQSPRYRICM